MPTTISPEKKTPPPAPSGDPFGAEFFAMWLESLAEHGTVVGPVYVPSAEMTAEAVFLASRGFAVKLADPDRAAVDRARSLARSKGTRFADTFSGDLFNVKPWHLSSVSTIVDRVVLASLGDDRRFAYANRVGRILPPGGRLIGVFRIGADKESNPRPVPLDLFGRLLHRYFVPEQFSLAATPAPGADQAWCGVLRRK